MSVGPREIRSVRFPKLKATVSRPVWVLGTQNQSQNLCKARTWYYPASYLCSSRHWFSREENVLNLDKLSSEEALRC